MEKYLTIKLNEEYFALSLKDIREIIPYSVPSPVPNMPPYIAGLIHLRGFFLPLVDLKKIFGIQERQGVKKKIVVISFFKRVIGMDVDEAEDIISVEKNEIIPTPNLITSINSNFFLGGFYLNGKIILIIDLKRVFTDVNLIKEISKRKPA